MSFIIQPNPEGYLEQIERDRSQRGSLRVYLSYAAGTGKTYAMLSAARALLAEGRDVLVGLIETHGREDTAALLEGLPILPRKSVRHGKEWLEEFDLEGALERNPSLILIDEMAHSNVGECRHPKRWSDITDLLEAGIDVYTTLNVQHLESVTEVVAGVTGVTVRELVPDSVLEGADEIVMIDLPIGALLERLDSGKVYRPEQARRARQGFFQTTHLLALRELALRETARHVDEDARDHMRRQSLVGPWPAGERLLVCVGPSPTSERLVRATKRLADGMAASWIALHVDTGQLIPVDHQRVDSHLQLAHRLGAEVIRQTSHTIIDCVLETIANKNVTKVVTGRTPRTNQIRTAWRPSLADAVLHQVRGVDVLILAGDQRSREPSVPKGTGRQPSWRPGGYLGALGLVALATVLGLPLAHLLSPAIQLMFYMAVVVATAYLYGPGPSNWASILSVMGLNFLFVPPRFSFMVSDPTYWLSFIGLFLNGLLVSRLTASVRAQSRSAQLREADAVTLLAVSRDLARAESIEELAQAAKSHLEKTFGPAVVLLEDETGQLKPKLLDHELAVADRAFRTGKVTGKGTQTLAGSAHQWHPLKGPTRILGVAGLSEALALEARRREEGLLEAILNQVSAALERHHMAEAAKAVDLQQASERLRVALLNSVSHDLRIPLVSIQGALSSLQDQAILVDQRRREALISNALSETDRLNRLVGNLLQKTRLDSGYLTLKRLPCEVDDLIKTTVYTLRHRLCGRPLKIEIEPELPLVCLDFVLISQVLTNLLENALAYSEADSPIDIHAFRCSKDLVVEVSDRGVGLEGVEVERLFDHFERGKAKNTGGLGLGLSICRGLIEAHDGQIGARDRENGGAVFRFTLPLEGVRGE